MFPRGTRTIIRGAAAREAAASASFAVWSALAAASCASTSSRMVATVNFWNVGVSPSAPRAGSSTTTTRCKIASTASTLHWSGVSNESEHAARPRASNAAFFWALARPCLTTGHFEPTKCTATYLMRAKVPLPKTKRRMPNNTLVSSRCIDISSTPPMPRATYFRSTAMTRNFTGDRLL